MPRAKQTRRSISVSSAVYDRIKLYCEPLGVPKSKFVEERVIEFLNLQKKLHVGARVNYHAIVGGPITLPNTVITGGPYERGDHRSWRIEGKPGTIDEAALSPVA